MNLPESWRELRLGDVCQIGSGDGAPQEDHWFSKNGEPFVRVSDLSTAREDSRIYSSRDKVTSSAIEQLRLRKWSKDSLLLPKSGASALLNQRALLGVDACVVSHLAILKPTDLIDPDFLYWWSTKFDAARVIPDPSYPSIRLQDLARVKIALPTLSEQKYIVDLMNRAESTPSKRSRHYKLDLMIKSALDRLVLSRHESEWVQLGTVVNTRYGTSVSADATSKTGVAVLRIPNVIGGEVDTDDLKFVDLPQPELNRLNLTTADVLIVRSNGNPEYVGRSAPITEDLAKSAMVYASYLIRLRTDTTRLLPEYLSAFMNSAFGRAAMRNAIRTTAGQSNLSGENLTKVKLPIPSIAEQERFRDFWLQVRELRRLIAKSESIENELRDILSVDALSGQLTSTWREKRSVELTEVARTRDTLLHQIGTKIALRGTVNISLTENANLNVRPVRHRLLEDLSEFQRQVLVAFINYCQSNEQPLLVEDPEVFASFCDDSAVFERLEHFGEYLGNRIRRTLSQLAALGLITKVTLPKHNLETGDRDYLKAFRPLRSDEHSRMADLQSIRSILSPVNYYFSAHLDYETSERAGAEGMFQVISVEDDDGKDFTYLVDQGKHYASLDALKMDIAIGLKVEAHQIDLEEL